MQLSPIFEILQLTESLSYFSTFYSMCDELDLNGETTEVTDRKARSPGTEVAQPASSYELLNLKLTNCLRNYFCMQRSFSARCVGHRHLNTNVQVASCAAAALHAPRSTSQQQVCSLTALDASIDGSHAAKTYHKR